MGADKATLGPLSTSAEGRAALLRAAIMRVGKTTEVIRDTATRFGDAAKQIPTLQEPNPLRRWAI